MTTAARIIGPLGWGTILVVFSGCMNDHRISVDELKVIEQEYVDASSVVKDDEAMAAVVQLLDRELGAYKLGPGDVVAVQLSGIGEGSGFGPIDLRIDREGNLTLPAVGAVNVGGLEIEDAEKALTEAYVPAVFRDAVAYIAMTEAKTTNVMVTGAVSLPGVVPLPRTERNMLFAINLAGGLSEAAGRVKLRRLRRPTEEVELDLSDPRELAAALSLDPLENGDIIRVMPADPNTVYVGGLVNSPLNQQFAPGVKVSVLQALAGAGGLRYDVTPREATLVRRLPDGKDVHVKLDLDRIRKGEDPNIQMAAGDILWVPPTIETVVQEWIAENIFIRAGATVTYTVTAREDLHSRFDNAGINQNLEDSFNPFGFLQR